MKDKLECDKKCRFLRFEKIEKHVWSDEHCVNTKITKEYRRYYCYIEDIETEVLLSISDYGNPVRCPLCKIDEERDCIKNCKFMATRLSSCSADLEFDTFFRNREYVVLSHTSRDVCLAGDEVVDLCTSSISGKPMMCAQCVYR